MTADINAEYRGVSLEDLISRNGFLMMENHEYFNCNGKQTSRTVVAQRLSTTPGVRLEIGFHCEQIIVVSGTHRSRHTRWQDAAADIDRIFATNVRGEEES